MHVNTARHASSHGSTKSGRNNCTRWLRHLMSRVRVTKTCLRDRGQLQNDIYCALFGDFLVTIGIASKRFPPLSLLTTCPTQAFPDRTPISVTYQKQSNSLYTLFAFTLCLLYQFVFLDKFCSKVYNTGIQLFSKYLYESSTRQLRIPSCLALVSFARHIYFCTSLRINQFFWYRQKCNSTMRCWRQHYRLISRDVKLDVTEGR